MTYGYVYPTEHFYQNAGHHRLPIALSEIRRRTAPQRATALLKDLAKQIHSIPVHPEQTLILSSEYFQNCDPTVVRALFDRSNYEVTVVSYLREQVGYVGSAYSQRVWGSGYAHGAEVFLNNFSLDYQNFVDSWTGSFRHVRFRVYDRRYLADQDVVRDFWKSFLNIHEPPKEVFSKNVSLTRKYLSLNLRMNNDAAIVRSANLRRALKHFSRTDDSGKFQLPRYLARNIGPQVRAGNKVLADRVLENGVITLSQGSADDLLVLRDAEYAELVADVQRRVQAMGRGVRANNVVG